jgi:cobalt-zinc-cadmium efflux system membrane fusion protein
MELSISDILASNPNIKIGSLQKKLIKQNVNCTGRIEIPPNELVSVHSKSEGFIEVIRYITGDFVKKGAVLMIISSPDLVEKQRILLETKAELTLATKEYERKSKLQSENATTQKAIDASYAGKELLSARYMGLKSDLELRGIDVIGLEKEQKFKTQLPIYSTISGYVHDIPVNRGQMIQPHDRLMEITNNDHIHLELQVLSKDVALLKLGQKVRFTLPNNPKIFNATIEKLNPALDTETGTLQVHCHIDEDQDEVIIGMFVNAKIEINDLEVKGLPIEAVIKEGENYYGYVVSGNLLKKQLLENAEAMGNFIIFDSVLPEKMVISGAYYVE